MVMESKTIFSSVFARSDSRAMERYDVPIDGSLLNLCNTFAVFQILGKTLKLRVRL